MRAQTKMEDGQEVVRAQWVKMLVRTKGEKGYEKHYASHHGYYKLNQNESHTLIAFLRPMFDEPLPHHLEACNTYEQQTLDKQSNRSGSL